MPQCNFRKKRKTAEMEVANSGERISISALVMLLGALTTFALAIARILELFK